MKDFVKRMIEEHSQLVVRIKSLDSWVYSENSDKDNKVEFANKCIQLSAMRTYEEALRARLENQNVLYSDGEYFEKCAQIVETLDNDTSDEKSIDENGVKEGDK